MSNTPPDFASVRLRFPGAQGTPYFDTAARGLVSIQSSDAAKSLLSDRLNGTADKPAMFDTVERVRDKFARLIKGQSDEVALTKNVSEGLNIVANAIDWKAGDNVVLCPELEHPSNLYPWFHLQREVGIEVKLVSSTDGRMPVAAMQAAIDDRTRVVTCSFVTFAPGLRSALQDLATDCAARDVLLLVDAAQGIGVLDLDMSSLSVGAMSVSTQKGLMALYGMGFLYVRKSWIERLTPRFLSRFSIDLGVGAHEAASGGEDYRLHSSARRFEIGNHNFIGATTVEPALDLLLECGIGNVETHVIDLNARLVRGLAELGWPVFAPEEGVHRAHMVAIGGTLGQDHDRTSDDAIQRLYDALQKASIRLTIRRGLIRLSSHVYNDLSDVERVLDVASSVRP